MIPKKKYRDKVRDRLIVVKTILLSDPDRLMDMMKRVGIGYGNDVKDKVEAIRILLERDIPALLDALDEVSGNKELV